MIRCDYVGVDHQQCTLEAKYFCAMPRFHIFPAHMDRHARCKQHRFHYAGESISISLEEYVTGKIMES